MSRRLLSLLALSLAAGDGAACRTRPLAYGEALFVVDTDAAIPKHVGRLRVDIMRDDDAHTLLETRDIIALRPEDWPISFSVTADEEAMRTALVRLRAYPQGHVVTRAEAALDGGSEPAYATSIEAACASPSTLTLGQPVNVKRGRDPITVTLPSATDAGTTCGAVSVAGSYVAKLEIVEPGPYRIEVLSSTPAPTDPGGSITISLRTDCAVATTQTICNDARPAAIETTLAPGTYYVVTGGAEPATADFQIVARKADQPLAPAPLAPLPSDAETREPEVGVTIDRLVRVTLVQGYRGTVPVVMAGECFGTPADIESARTCTDRSNVLVPVNSIVADSELERVVPRPPPWAPETPEVCALPPRNPTGQHDEEICVPGTAFILGDLLAITDGDRRSRPERMRVVAPFYLDKFEYTIGRYRSARARGFADKTPPVVNDGPIDPTGGTKACTFSTTDMGREAFPLDCVTFEEARALCQFDGADLPAEDQWELAATATRLDAETQYPWGDDAPTCDRVVVERTSNAPRCLGSGFGPLAVDDPTSTAPGHDVTSLGIVGLAGNVQEWLATGFYAYDHSVWQLAGLRAPILEQDSADAPLRAARGGDWAGFATYATGSARRFEPPLGNFNNVGFRCARPGK